MCRKNTETNRQILKKISGCIFIPALALLFLAGCQKSGLGSSVLVTVNYHGQPVEQARLYLKYDTLSNPGIPLSQYDQFRSADASGQAYFENLPAGKFFLVTTGYSSEAKGIVQGQDSISLNLQQYSTLTVDIN